MKAFFAKLLCASAWPALGCSAVVHAAVLNVHFGGCAAVAFGPVCYLPDDNTLTLWVEASAGAAVSILVDKAPPAHLQSASQGSGTRHVIQVGDTAGALSITATTRNESVRWRLALSREPLPPWLSAARGHYREGRLAEARRAVQAVVDGSTGAPSDARFRGYALGLLGRIARREAATDDAQRQLEAAVAAHLDSRRYSEAVNDATVLAFTLLYAKRDFAGARASLALPGPMAQAPAESRYYRAYYRGLIELEAGNPRAALPGLREAAQLAESMGWKRLALSAEQALATQLQNIGRHAEAHAVFSKWRDRLPADLAACERANFLTNTGWAALLMLEAGQAADDPTAVLTESLRLNDAACSVDARANARVNLALAHLHAGRLMEAQASLTAVVALAAKPALRTALWWHDIAGRVALAAGDTGAATAQFDTLEQLARLTLSRDAQWRAALRKAEVHLYQQDLDAALQYFEQARALRDDELLRVPVDEGRGHVLAIRARAFKGQMQALLQAERFAQAMQLLRGEHAAELRLLAPASAEALAATGFYAAHKQAREHMLALIDSLWAMPVDELERAQRELERQQKALRARFDQSLQAVGVAPQAVSLPDPPVGEVVLAFHQTGNGWWVLLQTNAGVSGVHPGCDQQQATALAQCLLDAAAIASLEASTVALLAPARLDDVDFHALALAGEPMLERMAVRYQIETGHDASSAPDEPLHALFVADPAGRLPAARLEVHESLRQLEAAGGWSSALLEGADATLGSVRAKLRHTSLFHFAGHAEYGGFSGWDSRLALAAGESLGVADILAMPAVPRIVVLSGCDTARQQRNDTAASIGLAQAFLARGSRLVIATSRPVSDHVAAALTGAFYRHWNRGIDPSGAFRAAQLQLKKQRPSSDWAAFRLLTRPAGE